MPAKALRSRSRRRQRRPALWTSIFLSSWMCNSISEIAGSSKRLINVLPQRLIRRLSAGRRDVEKQFSSWTYSKTPTGESFNTSWSCAQPYGRKRPIRSAPGSGRTPRSTFLTPVSAATITCERFTMCLWANRRCISSMTVQLRHVTEGKGYVVNACFLGPPCRAIFLDPHAEVQLCPEGLVRADALGLFVPLQGSQFIQILSAWKWRDPSREQRALVRKQLADTKHAKLLLKTDQPVGYTVVRGV